MRLYTIIIISIFCNLALASGEETSIGEYFFDTYENDWVLMLGFGLTDTKIQHTETSSVTNFSSIGVDNSVSNTPISLSLMKEFMYQSRISFSAMFTGGLNVGSGDDTVNGVAFEEDLSGFHVGAGVSVNVNYFTYGMKLQPYIGAGVTRESAQYEMVYESGVNSITTLYDYTGLLADINMGARLLDPEAEMMSFVNVSYINPMSETVDAKATVGTAEGVLNVVGLEKSKVLVSLGFGFLF